MNIAFGNIYRLSPQKEQAYKDHMFDMSNLRNKKFAEFLDQTTGETGVLASNMVGMKNTAGEFYLLTQGGPVRDADEFRTYNAQHTQTKTPAENLDAYLQTHQQRIQYIV